MLPSKMELYSQMMNSSIHPIQHKWAYSSEYNENLSAKNTYNWSLLAYFKNCALGKFRIRKKKVNDIIIRSMKKCR